MALVIEGDGHLCELAGGERREVGFEQAPLLLGFVLGDLMEEKLRQAMVISRGSLWASYVFGIMPVVLISVRAWR